MKQSLCVLGRQPALGLAELESLLGADIISPLFGAALLDIPPDNVPFQRLGGTVKLARVVARIDKSTWQGVETYLLENIVSYAGQLPDGKLKFGLSAYGWSNLIPSDVERTGLKLKKVLVARGRSTRLVPNKTTSLSSAQVLHNSLTGQVGMELLIVKDGQAAVLAQTVAVQDIEAYAARDQARPKRDPKVGMLPPKLAQIIINLAVDQIKNKSLLDPFCGTGVILQEAFLIGYKAYGTDIEPRMIEYSKINLEWLARKHEITQKNITLEAADATRHKWQGPVEAVASETYLGQPLSALPPRDQLDKIIHHADKLHRDFLKNIGAQLKAGTRLCLAVPAWKNGTGFSHLPCLAKLKELGYNRVSFVRAKNDDLIYHREDQIVARELLVITRN